MSQVTLYLSSTLERRIKAEAKRKRLSVSKYVAQLLVERTTTADPFDDVFGTWQGDRLERPEPLPIEARDPF